jgi:hypothetical protein
MTEGVRGLRLLGVARVLFGTLVLLRTTPLLLPLHVPYLGSTFPLLGWPTPAWHVAAWGLGLPASVVAALCIARTLAVLLFTLGIHARASGVAGGLIGWIVLAQDATGYINTFNLLFLGLVVLSMSGAGSAWALRAEPEIDPRSGLALTRAFVVSVYAWSGIAKLNSPWLHGEVLQQLRTSGIVRGWLSDALLSSATGCTAAAWGIAATELAVGPLLLWPRTRRPAVVAALAFHAVLQVTVHPDFFGFAMAVLLLAFVERPLEHLGANVSMMRAMGVFGALFAMVACSTATTETRSPDASMSGADAASPAGEAESTPDADPTGDASSMFIPIPDAARGAGDLGLGLDATDLDAAGPDPSPLACDADAGSDAGLCPPPHSECADSEWLVYYDNGQCVSGQCTWEKRYVECSIVSCFGGACQAAPTQ